MSEWDAVLCAVLCFACGIGLGILFQRGAETRHTFGEIQQFCAKAGRAQLDDTARVLRVLQMNPAMLKSLLYGLKKPKGEPDVPA